MFDFLMLWQNNFSESFVSKSVKVNVKNIKTGFYIRLAMTPLRKR